MPIETKIGTLSLSDESENDPSALSPDDSGSEETNQQSSTNVKTGDEKSLDNIFDVDEFKAPTDSDDTAGEGKTPTTTRRERVNPALKKAGNNEEESVEGEGEKLEGETEATGEAKEEVSKETEQALPKKRNYEGLPEEDVSYLKKLPNAIFRHVEPIVRERNKLRLETESVSQELTKIKSDPNRLPDSFYEHENAYVLSPQFTKISATFDQANYEANFWEQQLINIEQGQPWHELAMDAQGRYIKGAVHETPTPQDKFSVTKAYNSALKIAARAEADADNLKAKFSQEHKFMATYYDSASGEMFKKLPENLQPTDEQRKIFMDSIHPSHRNTSLAKMAAGMFSVILRQAAALKAKENPSKKPVNGDADERAALNGGKPKPRIAPGGKINSIKNNSKEIDLEELDSEMTT